MNVLKFNSIFLLAVAMFVMPSFVACDEDEPSEATRASIGGTVGKAVDLGLPSGTLWADRNLGASSPNDFGSYYA